MFLVRAECCGISFLSAQTQRIAYMWIAMLPPRNASERHGLADGRIFFKWQTILNEHHRLYRLAPTPGHLLAKPHFSPLCLQYCTSNLGPVLAGVPYLGILDNLYCDARAPRRLRYNVQDTKDRGAAAPVGAGRDADAGATDGHGRDGSRPRSGSRSSVRSPSLRAPT
jgi:hypothetical protein